MKNPNLGGKRPGSGRKKGVPNKVTVELKQMAGQYTEEALQTLVEIMRNPETSMGVRLAAVNSLLDRAHGRPAQSIELEEPQGKNDPELYKKLEEMFKTRMDAARERQRKVLIERGILAEGEEI